MGSIKQVTANSHALRAVEITIRPGPGDHNSSYNIYYIVLYCIILSYIKLFTFDRFLYLSNMDIIFYKIPIECPLALVYTV